MSLCSRSIVKRTMSANYAFSLSFENHHTCVTQSWWWKLEPRVWTGDNAAAQTHYCDTRYAGGALTPLNCQREKPMTEDNDNVCNIYYSKKKMRGWRKKIVQNKLHSHRGASVHLFNQPTDVWIQLASQKMSYWSHVVLQQSRSDTLISEMC